MKLSDSVTAVMESPSGHLSQGASRARLSVMNFLSEAAHRHPNSISFLSGLPASQFLKLEPLLESVPSYRDRVGQLTSCGPDAASSSLLQYGRTMGTINDLVTEQAAKDHGVVTDPARVIITNGCQEALALCLQTLCSADDDVALTRNPTYIGITGAAAFSGISLLPVNPETGEGLPDALRRRVVSLLEEGKRPRVLYLIPEFDNPTGDVLTVSHRLEIIDICAEFEIVVLEDNAYEMLRYEGDRSPTMTSLDDRDTVVYLGTYSKLLCPAVRVGFAVIPRTLHGSEGRSRALLTEINERKSFLTVSTSQLSQAVVGGVLLAEGSSFARFIAPALEHYSANRDRLLDELAAEIGPLDARIRWNRPNGGFFVSMQLPFPFGHAEMRECADRYGTLVLPMSFFALDDSQSNSVRLSFSNVAPQAVAAGVRGFARFVEHRLCGAS